MSLQTRPIFFYVIRLPDGEIQKCIDAIRVLADPGEKHQAHITVRGPYRRLRDMREISHMIVGTRAFVSEVGNFFNEGQNTLFFACEADNLPLVWDKADYDFNPHITLYDGHSREFAELLWGVLNKYKYSFSFLVGGLVPISSRSHQRGLLLLADFDADFISRITGMSLDSSLPSLSETSRLELIDGICAYLASKRQDEPTDSLFPNDSPPARALIRQVRTASDLLVAISALARANTATLGFLPEGAFDSYAAQNGILAAVNRQGELLGYLIYRDSRQRATLVHLCVHPEHRGKGLARLLVNELITRTVHLRGILVNSRRDYSSNSLWPRLGFAAIGEGPGRGKTLKTLTRWWYQQPRADLFSLDMREHLSRPLVEAVIDLNVFYDLFSSSPSRHVEESLALQADWLVSDLTLCVVAELFNEIDRIRDETARKHQKAFAHEFKRVSYSVDEFEDKLRLLRQQIGKPADARQESDLRQIAQTAASGIEYFVTRDDFLLRNRESIESKLGVKTVRPLELILQLDEIRNSARYHPRRLRSTSLQILRINSTLARSLPPRFVARDLGEKQSEFRNRLNTLLTPISSRTASVITADREPVALFVTETKHQVLSIPVFRVRPGPLAPTLAREIASTATEDAIRDDCLMIRILDPFCGPHVSDALWDAGFTKNQSGWTKFNVKAVGSPELLAKSLDPLHHALELSDDERISADKFRFALGPHLSSEDVMHLERALKPLKILGDYLPTFLIPIKAVWAQQLFDSSLAEQTLFGANVDLMLRWENVYYRSPRRVTGMQGAFRILWYVTRDSRYKGTSSIKAYSLGDGCQVVQATEAYRLYHRLGVYEMKDLLKISKDPAGLVMVIRFSETEVFDQEIELPELRAIVQEIDGQPPTLRAPFRISDQAFKTLYLRGRGA